VLALEPAVAPFSPAAELGAVACPLVEFAVPFWPEFEPAVAPVLGTCGFVLSVCGFVEVVALLLEEVLEPL
jgi:hypothetical protein